MKGINISKLLLAILVISMFVAVGVAIAYRNVWLVLLFIFLGFAIMGYGLSRRKRK
ncbi:DUF5325 family protein [Virgibacillus halodenitrificans]|uniref:DUF5325 family protein n=1 Tax=Virgibacillus halodenitrificans TaxID=1482 RepID=A0ABR7VR90_VIRHA|nr:DUF5325 family protein [Virgibacillus halodenitrificans]MBD1224425.1 DUF5325 family protein [Virgibacillus halodenitrificans]MCG1029782.1 DUF5325 family protein [Virgibacillus halodenitrificans]MCJ0931339.1 YlaF family protein [Virgibacillus halodenitrificans]MEC2161117.1 DUF5325 family protein [Virgibacillus halodenitrificans]WHX27036.1 DUF5325 family protein [Virgibacillus halodenitrificans]